jgi:hypothetical protein
MRSKATDLMPAGAAGNTSLPTSAQMHWGETHGGLAFRGGDDDMTGVNGASIEGQRKSFKKLGI